MNTLTIFLGDVPVGELSLLADEVSEFRFLASYRDLPRRPVLGQAFEDDLLGAHRARMALPPFFSNLLPEGALRALLAQRLEVSSAREFFLLARLGADLPGAVRAIATTALAEPDPRSHPEAAPPAGPLKFSLAGVQLKLSMLREGRGLTLPSSGFGGDWIVKLPGSQHHGVPENEYSTMQWARGVGLDVPEVELVQVRDLGGLPVGLAGESELALAVRRFDRPANAPRIHIEDFAQILGKYPAEKYGSTNYETLGRIILKTAGSDAFDEFVRRLAFVIVSANGDAHIKNWSLIYPDGRLPRLAPAYDLVATIEFIQPDTLALNLSRNKMWNRLGLEHFTTFARRVGVDPLRVTTLVTDTIRRALEFWPELRRQAFVSPTLASRLEEHWSQVPLIKETR